MNSILDAGIELHHARSPETDDGHPHRRHFSPLPMQELIDKIGEFDASLIAYNTQACARDDRFYLTIPDRLITSVAAGVPVAIPRQGYGAIKSYLRDYPMLEFDTADELAQELADRSLVAQLREAAWNFRSNYDAARYGPVLAQFLNRLIATINYQVSGRIRTRAEGLWGSGSWSVRVPGSLVSGHHMCGDWM